jgi:hypothetical protein
MDRDNFRWSAVAIARDVDVRTCARSVRIPTTSKSGSAAYVQIGTLLEVRPHLAVARNTRPTPTRNVTCRVGARRVGAKGAGTDGPHGLEHFRARSAW